VSDTLPFSSGPQQAHAATQTTSDIHLRLQLAVQQLKAVDASAFCQVGMHVLLSAAAATVPCTYPCVCVFQWHPT
jgi:hypothetical protein